MAISIKFNLNSNLYQRDPQETDLGRRIIEHSIKLICKLGFENFTFKKLADNIHSTEASVYRYFSNKHTLLVYLVNWYWEWVRYLIDYNTVNINDPVEKLNIALETIIESSKSNSIIDYVDENLLHHIIIAESTKAYHTKEVDEENKEGYFYTYKALCKDLAHIILAVNPHYPYPRALSTTLLETANDQLFFIRHLPSLSDIKKEDIKESPEPLKKLLKHFCFTLIKSESGVYSNQN